MAAVGETRAAYRAAGRAARAAKSSVIPPLRSRDGSLTALFCWMSAASSSRLPARSTSGEKSAVTASVMPLAQRSPRTAPAGMPAPHSSSSCSPTSA